MKITLYYVVSQLQHFVVVIKRYTRKGDAFHSTSIHYWNVKIRVYSPNVWIYKYSSLSMVPTIVVLVFSSFFLSFPREETYIYIYIHTTCLSVHRSSKHGIWIFNTLYQCWCFPFVSLFLSSFLLCSFFLGKRGKSNYAIHWEDGRRGWRGFASVLQKQRRKEGGERRWSSR